MTIPGGPLDPRQDPDRYDPDRDDAVRDVGLTPVERGPAPRLDPDADPDRFRPGAGSRRADPTLSDLLGASAGDDDEPRDTYTWFLGLLGVLAFLGLVALLFGRVLSPG